MSTTITPLPESIPLPDSDTETADQIPTPKLFRSTSPHSPPAALLQKLVRHRTPERSSDDAEEQPKTKRLRIIPTELSFSEETLKNGDGNSREPGELTPSESGSPAGSQSPRSPCGPDSYRPAFELTPNRALGKNMAGCVIGSTPDAPVVAADGSTTPTTSPGRHQAPGLKERSKTAETRIPNPLFIPTTEPDSHPARTLSEPTFSQTPRTPLDAEHNPKSFHFDNPTEARATDQTFTFKIPTNTANLASPLQKIPDPVGQNIASGTFGSIYKISYESSSIPVRMSRSRGKANHWQEEKTVLLNGSSLVIKLVADNDDSAIPDAELEAKYLKELNMPDPQTCHSKHSIEQVERQCPFIAEILDYFFLRRSPRTYCLAFPLYAGGNLLSRYNFLKEGQSGLIPSPQSTLNITYQLLHALSYLMMVGYVHADIKPENIQFERENSDRLRLIDFGSTEPIWDHNGEPKSVVVCTDQYRPPEIILRKPCQRRETKGWDFGVDIWSSGCIVFEMLHGSQFCPVDSNTDYKRFKELAQELHPDEQIQGEYETALQPWEIVYHREQLYRLQHVSSVNPFCNGFDKSYLMHPLTGLFWLSRCRRGDKPRSNKNPKIIKWCFDHDYRVDYSPSEQPRLKPCYNNAGFDFENATMVELKSRATETLTGLDKRYLSLSQLAQKMLMIDSKCRPNANQLLEEFFDDSDYPEYIPLPSDELERNSRQNVGRVPSDVMSDRSRNQARQPPQSNSGWGGDDSYRPPSNLNTNASYRQPWSQQRTNGNYRDNQSFRQNSYNQGRTQQHRRRFEPYQNNYHGNRGARGQGNQNRNQLSPGLQNRLGNSYYQGPPR